LSLGVGRHFQFSNGGPGEKGGGEKQVFDHKGDT
jgi:hypothetical protein